MKRIKIHLPEGFQALEAGDNELSRWCMACHHGTVRLTSADDGTGKLINNSHRYLRNHYLLPNDKLKFFVYTRTLVQRHWSELNGFVAVFCQKMIYVSSHNVQM